MQRLSHRQALLSSLLACPVLIAVLTPTLSPFRSLHGTLAEPIVLVALAMLPLGGVVGIVRFSRCTPWVKAFWSLAYYLAMLVPATCSLIFIGCSWAGACF